jgi:modulator of drug activity B
LFFDVAKTFVVKQGCTVLETKIEGGYTPEADVDKHLAADLVILQTPVNWIITLWIHKKYVDEVFNSGLRSTRLLARDGRIPQIPLNSMGRAVR